MRWGLLVGLAAVGCGGGEAEETWLFSLDRAAGAGCSESLGGRQQYAVTLYRDGDGVTGWVPGRRAVLSGTWSRDELLLAEAPEQSAASTIAIRATPERRELVGDWDDNNPTCTQTIPLRAWHLDLSRRTTLAITHNAGATDRRGDCGVSTRSETWTVLADLYADGERSVLVVEDQALLGTVDEDAADVQFSLSEETATDELLIATRYQLDLASRTGAALLSRTDVQGGQTFEDCVEETPVTFTTVE